MRSRFMDMAAARGVQVRDAAGSDSYLLRWLGRLAERRGVKESQELRRVSRATTWQSTLCIYDCVGCH